MNNNKILIEKSEVLTKRTPPLSPIAAIRYTDKNLPIHEGISKLVLQSPIKMPDRKNNNAGESKLLTITSNTSSPNKKQQTDYKKIHTILKRIFNYEAYNLIETKVR